MMQYQLAAALLGYLLGSIPFGLVLTRLGGLGDIRSIGSGNIGATNVLRTGRKDLAVLTLLLDGGKGTAAALTGAQYGPEIMVIAAFAAFLGPNGRASCRERVRKYASLSGVAGTFKKKYN